MLNSLLGSILVWSIMMLALIFYIFGLVFVQGVANFLTRRALRASHEPVPEDPDVPHSRSFLAW